MAFLSHDPAPISTPISDVDKKGNFTGYVPIPWSDYFNGLDTQLAQTFALSAAIKIPSGSAAVGVTPITSEILSAGLYRISYYVVELQADNVGSQLQVNISWTDRATTRSLAGANITANSINIAQTNTYLLRIDRATPITYNVGYSSTGGAPKMIYSLDVTLEQMLATP
jgi:hypothetical protein